MSEKELYRQKYQAQLDEVKVEIAKLKARAGDACTRMARVPRREP